MLGASISRWTMAYFAAALLCLLVALTAIVAGYGYPHSPLRGPETLVIVHLVAIGWLSLLMLGALFQFVPVLVGRPLHNPILTLPALLILLMGLGLLLAGFLRLAGTIKLDLPLLAMGGGSLAVGFMTAAWPLARTMLDATALPLPARFVATGLVCLGATLLLGVSFALVLSGVLVVPPLIELSTQAVQYHAVAGFGGWLTCSAIGVSYRLLPMFMLSPDTTRTTSRTAWWCFSVALLLIVAVIPIVILLDAPAGIRVSIVAAVAGALAIVALTLYGIDLVFLYRSRKRRKVELNIKAACVALVSLYAAAVLLLITAARGTLDVHAGAITYLAAFGWLTGLGLSQLYKIVPFLTWLECYGPIMGRKPTPRVQDLVVERRDEPWFALYFTGVSVGTVALLAEAPGLFRAAAAATLIAVIAIITELVLTRRLYNVAPERRLPEGTRLPRLFLPAENNR
jgi:hypothetical protein